MDALVRELMPYVGRVCGAIALDRGDDAMQETFIAVLRNLRIAARARRAARLGAPDRGARSRSASPAVAA